MWSIKWVWDCMQVPCVMLFLWNPVPLLWNRSHFYGIQSHSCGIQYYSCRLWSHFCGLRRSSVTPTGIQCIDLLDQTLQLEGSHQPLLPLLLNLGHLSELQASFSPTESKGIISFSSYHSALIASGSALMLRVGRPHVMQRHGSKMAGFASKPDMSNLRSYLTGYQEIIWIAKSTFIAEAFETRLLWPHQKNHQRAAYGELVLEAVFQKNTLVAPPGNKSSLLCIPGFLILRHRYRHWVGLK